MDVGLFPNVISVASGTLALHSDRWIARAMSLYSAEAGELFRKCRLWGTFAAAPDSHRVYQNYLFFIRFWGAVKALFGIGVFPLK